MRPVCVACGIEMAAEYNGCLVYHPYEKPDLGPVVEQRNGVNIINTDQMMEINESDIDFIVPGDLYRCPRCNYKIVTDYGERIINYVNASQEELKRRVANHPYTIEILRKRR